MGRNLSGTIGLVAASSQIRADAFFAAVQDGLGGIMHGTEIGGLNLDHVAGFGVGEFADVFQRVAPFVGDEFDRDTAFVERCGERGQRVALGVMRAVIDRSFDPEPERSGEFREGGEVAADRRPVVFREDFADRPVNVDMKDRVIGRRDAELTDPVRWLDRKSVV